MTVEEMLAHWAAKRLNVRREEVISVEFEHEEGWVNDSGTAWPETNIAIVRLARTTTEGKRRRSTLGSFSIDGIENLPALLKEILDVSEPSKGEIA